MTTFVFTDRASPIPGKRIEEISALLAGLMKQSESVDPDIALNALLGTYVNLALKTNRLAGASKAMQQTAAIAQQVAKSTVTKESSNDKDRVLPSGPSTDFVDASTALMDRLEVVLAGTALDVVLTALLNLFMNIARQYPECTNVSAQAALRASQTLTAAATGKDAGATLH